MTLLQYVFLLPIIFLSVSTVLTFYIRGRTASIISSTLSLAACLSMLFLSINVLLYSRTYRYDFICWPFPSHTMSNFAVFRINIDTLSAYFIFIIGLIGAVATIYGLKYINKYSAEHMGFFSLNYSLFILSMYMTVIVSDLFWFIVFWELMTLSSQFLVSFEKEKKRAIWAGYKYFTVTKIGSEFIIIGSLIAVFVLNNFNTSFRSISINAAEPLGFITVLLMFMGLAVKAAVVPFHTWLPDAHPEAPSHVSALLSGVMIKVPIYMMIRLFYEFTVPGLVWGIMVSTVGVATLTVGAMYALKQTDSKRLLAYSSIEHIGYVVLGLGTSLLLVSLKNYLLAGVALIACLYHLINHALFKSALFLTAGSVEYATGLRDLNRLGGLAKYMPYTALAALIASLSISGIPPFNGFAGKWLVYCSTFLAGGLLLVYGVLALFISSVTSANFIKYFTGIFTRNISRINASVIREVPYSMSLSQLVLCILCIVFGVFPLVPLSLILPVLGVEAPHIYDVVSRSVSINIGYIGIGSFAHFYPLVIAVILSTFLPLIYVVAVRGRGSRYELWTCGSLVEKRRLLYPARSYYKDFEEVFGEIYSVGDYLYKMIVGIIPRKVCVAFKRFVGLADDPVIMYMVMLIIIVIALLVVGV